jgi:hypothetical protein
MASDRDRAKISTHNKAQIGSFDGFVLGRGQLKAVGAKMYKINSKYYKTTSF